VSKQSKPNPTAAPPPPEPVNVVDGIPDRAPTSPRWKFVVILLVFLAWVGFMVFVQIAGRPASQAGG